MPVPKLKDSADRMLHHWDNRRYPALVYVETTNFCNARCAYCLYERMERAVEYMSVADFRSIARKVKDRGLKIGAMFCFGEPLADGTLFQKIKIAREMNVAAGYLGINTNCTYLTEDKFSDIITHTGNITLSFVNTGAEFERLTKLSWNECYGNAVKFIQYRDRVKPSFKIQIGCNDVTGHNRANVQRAFKGYHVEWARDAEIKWGDKFITGVIDRSIMYHTWSCDGHKGAMQIKPNGDLLFCAYDVIRNETKFANIHTDTWETIEKNFKARWKEPSSLCLRCEFWWNYFQMKDNGWQRGQHIDSSWTEAYMGKDEMKAFWDKQHREGNIRYLTDTSGKAIWRFLNITPLPGTRVLNIGVGTGRCSKDLHDVGCKVDVLDVSLVALEAVKDIATLYCDSAALPTGTYDLAISHLVAQHMTDIDLTEQIKHVLRSLKPGGMFAIQYASNTVDKEYREDIEAQRLGLVRKSKEQMMRIIRMAGGKIIYHCETRYFDIEKATDDACWNGMGIVKA